TIFVLILRCASDHCPAGRSDQPILSLLEGAVRFLFNICWYLMVHDTMYPNNMSRAFGRKTAPQHPRSATILHIGYEVLFCMYLSVYAKPTFNVCCQKALFWSHLTIKPGPIESPSNIWQTVGTLVCC